jgi:hypothetical protein
LTKRPIKNIVCYKIITKETFGGLMKKLLAVCIIGLSLGTVGAFAEHPSGWGIGIVGRGGWSGRGVGGAALSLKAPSLPIYWAIDLGLSDHYFGLGVSGDYYLIDKALVPDINLDWYLGLGGYASLEFWNSSSGNDGVGIGVGVRVPVGLSWEFLKHFELFGDIVPNVGLHIEPLDLGFGVNGELGIRFWF